MRVIGRARLRDFWLRHPDAEAWLKNWWTTAIAADWGNLADIRTTYPHADGVLLDCGLVATVFNVRGGNYRLITRISYPHRRIYVKVVLSHREYDREAWKDQLCRE